ncbi:hypothetical protein LPN01_18685 [Sphingomonas sp. A2-49]|uniref:hypothetical protein n=1 Tax=Sphingomonas sp. A2-49 TaxID=1391375 RepID=UPI0021D1CA53|nr:hypothetical protein [Sphingomonas sp. A2-49]MCU6456110.1 hypothetical protein [Sphingomonas sp. A2-49]
MSAQPASAMFDTQAEAQRAVADLRAAGVPDGALSVLTQRGGVTTTADADGEVTDEDHGSVVRGILGGGALGAGLGVAALAIPGVGPLVAAGAIAASAVPGAMAIGAVAGAAAGTLNETLAKHGIDRDDAGYYGDHLGKGGVLVTVDANEGGVSHDTASDILYRNGGHNTRRSRVASY